MRKQDIEIQPFEVIEDEKGRYASGADLVRPDADAEEPRRRRWPLILLIWIAVVLAVGLIFILPAIEREMMRAPMVNLVAAVNAGDIAKLRSSFTPDAKVGYSDFSVKANDAIATAEPFLRNLEGTGSLRFTGLEHVKRLGRGRYEADFTVKFDLEDESLPYRQVVITKKGHVRLQRVGWFRWKVAKLTSNEPEFVDALSGMQLKNMLSW